MTNNKIKFSCADFTFPLLSHNKVLQLIHLLGFDAVDLGIFENRSHHYPSQIAKNPVREGKLLAEKLKDVSLEVTDVFLQTGEEPSVAAANDPQKTIRDNNRKLFLKMLDFTCSIGCNHITGLPGVRHKNVDLETDWERALEEAQWRVETAKKKNIVYSVEAHLGSILSEPDSALKFLNECQDLTLTLDYGHFIYQGYSNEAVHPLLSYASHFHARGGAEGKLQTIVKENKIDYETIVSRFKEIGYSGAICMEYVYQDWEGCNRTDNVSETILLYNLLNQYYNSQ